jgi:fatty acid amide hydrolase 2
MAVTVAPSRPHTHRSALDLAAAIRAGETSAREVVEAHIARLQTVQPSINPLAADRFEAAREEADAADRRVAEATDPAGLPPLLGVPCTVKESIALAGMPNCAGLLARRDHRATESAPTATRIMEAGAIPLGVTNVSEMTMWIESQNFVYGRTSNAYDPRRVAGGSSGGEGAAVGSGGSPIGLGTDIGGSIRLPAFFNGVFGHKCSAWLVPNSGHFPPAEGAISRMLSLGPLARRAEDLMPVLRIVAGADPGDPDTRADVELGDPGAVRLRGMPVVLAEHTSFIPVRRELREARDRAGAALADAGMEVRRVPVRAMRRAVEYYLTALRDGSARSFRDLLEAEMGETAKLGLRHTLPGALRRRGPHTLPTVILLGVERIAARTPSRMTRRALAAGEALAREVDDLLDGGVMLHPPYPRVAPKHGRTIGRPWVISPMAVFNLLGLPVTQVPLGLNSRGVPLGVQVVGGMDDDHVTIAAAMELERRFGGWVPPRD